MLPLQPLEIGHTVNSELVAQNDIEHCKNIDTENVNVNSIPEKSAVMERLGPYRTNPISHGEGN